MLKTKDDFQNLEETPAFQKLDNETAAAIQGGYNMQVFDQENYTANMHLHN
jgi:hypothetical protein